MAHESNINPTVLNPGDPYAQDESLPTPGSYRNYLSFCGYEPGDRVSADVYARAEAEFHVATQGWLAGTVSLEVVRSYLAPLGIQADPKHDRRGLLSAPCVLPDSVLADIAEDEVPDAGVLVERVLGDAFSAPSVAVFAALAWAPWMDGTRRAVDAWAVDEKDRPLVQAMRVIDRSPPCVFVDGVPIIPLNPRMTPTAGPPGCYVARAYLVGSEWHFSTRMDLPAVPDCAALERRVLVELWRVRTKERRSGWEDTLRQQPLMLYRAAYEGAMFAAKNQAQAATNRGR